MPKDSQMPDFGILDLSVAYIEAMQRKGRRPETLRAYSRDLAAFLGHVGDVHPDTVTSADTEAFLEHLAGEGKAISSVVRARDVIRAFWTWMRAEGYASTNPTETLTQTSKRENNLTRRGRSAGVASSDQISAILGNLAGLEDKLVTMLVASTGLPASDVVGLKVEDVTFTNDRHPEMPGGVAVLKMDEPAGNNRMIVVGDLEVVTALKKQARGHGPADLLFKVPMRTLQHRFRLAAKKAGVPELTLREVRRAGMAHPLERLIPRK